MMRLGSYLYWVKYLIKFKKNSYFSRKRSGWIFWSFIVLSAVVLITFIPITWFKKLWVVFMPANDDNSMLVNPPKSIIPLCLFNISRNIMKNAIARTCMYLVTISLLMVCSLVHLTECVAEENDGGNYTGSYSPCRNPWVKRWGLAIMTPIRRWSGLKEMKLFRGKGYNRATPISFVTMKDLKMVFSSIFDQISNLKSFLKGRGGGIQSKTSLLHDS